MTRISEAAAKRLLAGLLGDAPATPARRKGATKEITRRQPPTPQEPAQRATGHAPLIVTVAGLPPTVNHLYVTARGGRRVLTEAARAWYDAAIPAIREGARGYAVPPGYLRLSIVLYHLPRSRDIDNALKAAQDALARALGFDDKRIDVLTVARGVGKPARTVYTLEAL